jgi:hypothetical protein
MENNQSIFKCAKCGNTIMDYKGLAKVAGLWFYCLECEKCGNKSVLECGNQDSARIEDKLNKERQFLS